MAFDPKQVTPSQSLYLQRNDNVSFELLTNGTNVTVKINYRWLTPDGEIKEGEIDTPPFTAQLGFGIKLYEGWLLSFNARATNVISPGQWTFMQALIGRGEPAPTGVPINGVFWQGFVPAGFGNGWPGTPSKEVTDGAGTLRSITGTTPAAGADINEVVPTARRWTLLSFRAGLTASATVANRFPGFLIDDGTNALYLIRSSVAQTASQVNGYNLTPAQTFYNDTQTQFIIPAPGLTSLKAGFRIRTSTNGIQATDQWSAPQYLVAEWPIWDA